MEAENGNESCPDVPAGTGLYPIIDVDGRQPRHPDRLHRGQHDHRCGGRRARRLDGSGDLTDRGLEFHQQDAADAAGTDVAAWAIAEDGDETFWAEPLGAG